MKNLLILLIAIYLNTSCTNHQLNNKKNYGIGNNAIKINFINIPSIPHKLDLGKMSYTNNTPILSYRLPNSFNNHEIEYISKNTNTTINEKKIFLNLRYHFIKTESVLLYKGDSVKVIFADNKLPDITVFNRKTKKYDYNLTATINNHITHPVDSTRMEYYVGQYKNFQTAIKKLEEAKDKYQKEMQSYNIKRIAFIDSLYKKNELSEDIYNYNHKRFKYALQYNNDKMVSIINGNSDLHIKEFVDLLKKFVHQNIKKKAVAVSNGYVQNSVAKFDFVKNNDLFTQKTKDYLLTIYLKDIATDFSKSTFQNKYNQYLKTVKDTNLIAEIKNDFLTDYDALKKVENEVILINEQNQKTTLEKLINDNAGKVIYVDFWASWCAPCRQNLPYSHKLMQKYQAKDVLFAYISVDKNATKWRNALKEEKLNGYKYNYLALNYPKAQFYRKLNLRSIPRYLIYNKKGELIHKNAPNPKDVENIIEQEIVK